MGNFSDLGTIAGIDISEAEDRDHQAPMASSSDDLPIFQGRDRAFSFEVFNFSEGADLLPVSVESSAPGHNTVLAPVSEEPPRARPRGDSIIFDPTSFQDGGIHETNALRNSITVSWAGQKLKKESGIIPIKRTQPFGNDRQRACCGELITRHNNTCTGQLRDSGWPSG